MDNTAQSWPALEMYDAKYLSVEDNRSLTEWHASVADRPFHLVDELHAYAVDDVNVLRRAVVMYQQLFQSTLKINPFVSSCTTPGACLTGYRHLFMPADTILNCPENGFNRRRKQSVKAMKWIAWEAYQRGAHIRSAGTVFGEKRIKCGDHNYYVDGVIEEHGEPAVFFEFLGCLWHSHDVCNSKRMNDKHLDGIHTYEDIFQQTLTRLDRIRDAFPNCELIVMWECSWDVMYKHNLEMATYVNNVETISAIVPRAAFYGGRVEPLNMLREYSDPTVDYGAYNDFCSLYPYINKTAKYPSGAPEIIEHPVVEQRDGHDFLPYFGLAKVKIIPTTKLLHPVLPLPCAFGSTRVHAVRAVCRHSLKELLSLAFGTGLVGCLCDRRTQFSF
jgi:G:T-mismatch repair DNA endonuclease (very short patch repair protein)